MNDILTRICDEKRAHVERQKSARPISDLENQIPSASKPRAFMKALLSKALQNKPALIAEIKKASPSKGVIRSDFDPVAIAKAYEQAGGTCLSVLTDQPYFQGHDDYIRLVKDAVALPVLRKDFIIDPYQIIESRILDADCILLIVAALSDGQLQKFSIQARELGMDVLVEVHDQQELERALQVSPEIVGINNRNLKTMEVDLRTSERLLPQIDKSILKVAESGIYSHADLQQLQNAGANAFLVGESLMRAQDIETATRILLGTN